MTNLLLTITSTPLGLFALWCIMTTILAEALRARDGY